MMGTIYLGGVKVDKDLAKADEWFDKAIESDSKLVDVITALKAWDEEIEMEE